MQHRVFCPVATGEAEICTCGALFRGLGDWARPHGEVSTQVKTGQLAAVDGKGAGLEDFSRGVRRWLRP